MQTITTENLVLRDFSLADRDAYRALRDDQKFARFYSEEDVSTDKSDTLLDLFIAQSLELPRNKYQFAIVTKSGDLIGSCGIRLEADQQASVGCELGREWQKKGYALEAGNAVLAFGFDQRGVHRIYAETISENKAAIRLCKILGMRHEALFLENRFFQGRWWSTSVLAVLARDWRQRYSVRGHRKDN
ncbi:MAG: GNAT family protein [Collimonas pratensis]|uniref:GNAT family N-acetyltransferase n=1 Tax=Collimonas pratensis TaxID=279113 RepID=UPI003C724B5B